MSTAHAATIKQLLNDQSLAIVELKNTEKVEIGENFLAADESYQCLLKVIKVENNLATISSAGCVRKDLLFVGKKIEKSLFNTELVKSETEPTPPAEQMPTVTNSPSANSQASTQQSNTSINSSYASFVIGYRLLPKISIPISGYSVSGSDSGDFDFDLDNALTLGYEWSQFRQNSWNNGFQINYTNMKINNATLSTRNSGSSSVALSDTFTEFQINYVGKYFWEKVYFAYEFGVASSTNNAAGLFTKTMASRFHSALGLGINISEKFNLEVTTNSNSIDSSSVTISGVTLKPDLGYLRYIQLTGKFLF
jgi:hypothetical protein